MIHQMPSMPSCAPLALPAVFLGNKEIPRDISKLILSFIDFEAQFNLRLASSSLNKSISELMVSYRSVRRVYNAHYLLSNLHASFPSLTSLTMHSEFIRDVGIKSISTITTLTHLELGWINVTPNLTILNSLTRLKKLTLKICDKQNSPLSLYGLDFINLEELNIQFSFIEDRGIASLENFPALRSLSLNQCMNITGQIDFSDKMDFSSLKNLAFLECSKLTDAGVAKFILFTALESLTFSSCDKLTNASLNQIKALKHLKIVWVNNCALITKEGLESVKNYLRMNDWVEQMLGKKER